MKHILQTIQYLVAAAALFMLFYFSYLIAVSLGAVMLPVFGLLAVAVVLYAKLDHNKQGDQ
jgi:hypothetical protein